MHWVVAGIQEIDVQPIIPIDVQLVRWFRHGDFESGVSFVRQQWWVVWEFGVGLQLLEPAGSDILIRPWWKLLAASALASMLSQIPPRGGGLKGERPSLCFAGGED